MWRYDPARHSSTLLEGRDTADHPITSSVAGRRTAARLPVLGDQAGGRPRIGHGLRQGAPPDARENSIRVTRIEPGMVDTAFFDSGAPDGRCRTEDIARAVLYVLEQPPTVDVHELTILPTPPLA